MHTLDRALLINYLRSYLIVLTSVLSLYVVIDLFTNLDDFAGRGTFVEMILHIGHYYGIRLSQIFDKLCEAIALLAAMFTVAWLQRNNELLPQLSAGISTHRVLRPVIFGTIVMLAAGPLNQELVLPKIADELQIPRDDPNQERPIEMRGSFDSTGMHLEGSAGFRKDKRVKGFYVTFPEAGAAGMTHLQAEEAVFAPATVNDSAHWLLYNTTPDMLDPLPEQLTSVGPRRFRLNVRDADFDSMTRGSNLYSLATTGKLRAVLSRPDPRRLANVAVIFHMRFTRPIVGLLMVILGLSIILRDHNRHVLVSSGLCLMMCALFYGLVYGCKFLGETDLLAAPLAAWLPVLTFGPIALVQYDAMHT